MWRRVLVSGGSCSISFVGNTEFLHELIQSRPTDSEVSSCGSDSPGMPLECLLDYVAFHLLARLFKRPCRRRYCRSPIQFEIPCGYSRAARHDDAAFYSVLQFADVTRPRVVSHCTQRVRREHQLRAAFLSGIALQKLPSQNYNVLTALAKRQQSDRD